MCNKDFGSTNGFHLSLFALHLDELWKVWELPLLVRLGSSNHAWPDSSAREPLTTHTKSHPGRLALVSVVICGPLWEPAPLHSENDYRIKQKWDSITVVVKLQNGSYIDNIALDTRNLYQIEEKITSVNRKSEFLTLTGSLEISLKVPSPLWTSVAQPIK